MHKENNYMKWLKQRHKCVKHRAHSKRNLILLRSLGTDIKVNLQ